MPLSIRSFPRAILHVDGDSFFASCETSINPALKGKPVVTGHERGIASSMSYEAKARGVTRGMKISEVRKVCPEAVIISSDYETYSLFARRMYNIVRRYTPDVEEYSIDECFADLTGMRQSLRMSYEEIAKHVKADLQRELGMTFSVGLGPNKIIAKTASKWKKPDGLTVIPANAIHEYLKDIPAGKIWGIGPQTSAYLQKKGVKTALDLAEKKREWVEENLNQPYHEMWRELNGEFVNALDTENRTTYQSISRTRTFRPSSADKAFVRSQLSKNIEEACARARDYRLAAKEISFFLKTQDFRYYNVQLRLANAASVPQEILKAVDMYFDSTFRPGKTYRATGVTLRQLVDEEHIQGDLFGKSQEIGAVKRIFDIVDKVDARFGEHTVFLGSSLGALGRPKQKRGPLQRTADAEAALRKIDLPFMGDVRTRVH